VAHLYAADVIDAAVVGLKEAVYWMLFCEAEALTQKLTASSHDTLAVI
jgi:hypothetical protein